MEENIRSLWTILTHSLPQSPEENIQGFWSDGDMILCDSVSRANELADFLEAAGCDTVTGYYDPKEDKKSGMTDKYTGFAYIDLNM